MSDQVPKKSRRKALAQSKQFATGTHNHGTLAVCEHCVQWAWFKVGLHGSDFHHPWVGRERPLFRFSDTWQLVINTGTTIVTFLMVFLIQNPQNHDARAINLKLNEWIYAIGAAGDQILDINL